jgi:hypothetical protein
MRAAIQLDRSDHGCLFTCASLRIRSSAAVVMSPLPRKSQQNHDDEESSDEDNSHTYPPVFIHVLIVRSPRVGWVVTVQEEQAIMKRTRLNAAANAVRSFGSGVPDAISLSAAMAWLSE